LKTHALPYTAARITPKVESAVLPFAIFQVLSRLSLVVMT
jgi:hypothetical protein